MTEDKQTDNTGISRRGFVRGATAGVALVAGGAFLGGTPIAARMGGKTPTVEAPAAAEQPTTLPTNWSQTADVVVVGYGGSGAVCAITAFDAGASVLILEKTPSYAALGVANPLITGGGGSTSMNAGACAYSIDPVAAANYLYATSWGNTPMSNCQGLASMLAENPAWLTQMGIKYTTSPSTPEFPALPGSSGFGSISLTSGNVFFQQLDALVQKRGIPILFSTPATDLIQNPLTKEIVGAKALANSSEVLNIRANKAVILCAGGFEFNEVMKSDNFRCYPAHFYGWPFCTGDSVTMASRVGAALWHMGAMAARMVPWFPQYVNAFSTTAPAQHGWIYVDKHGNRYADETQLPAHSLNWWVKLSDFDLTEPAYTRIPSFIIFDETCRKAGAISSGSSGLLPAYLDPRPKWSSDNSAEIARGWIQQGADIPSLVAAINSTTYVSVPPGSSISGPAANIKVNMDPAVLTATVNAYNAACTAKLDPQFGRPASSLVPIQTPPFYSMPLWPGGPSAFGGPVRNQKGQVCDALNNPIPRLYAAGEGGCIAGGLLDGVSDNAQIIALGRVAGGNAAEETSWT